MQHYSLSQDLNRVLYRTCFQRIQDDDTWPTEEENNLNTFKLLQ